MDLNKLYKEIEEAEVSLNAKRLKYIKEALAENNGIIKLKFKEFKEFKETNDAFDFDDQFPVIIEINGIPMFLTEVYVKKNDFRIVLLDYDDMTLGDYDNTGENEQVAYFINYCLNQDKDGKRVEKIMRSFLTQYLQIETMRHGSLEERTGIAVERIMAL